VTYDRQLVLGDPLAFATRVVETDAKRVRLFHEMFHGEQGWLAATNELMLLHVDMAGPRSAPLPEPAQAWLAEAARRHALLPRPAQLGRAIAMGRR